MRVGGVFVAGGESKREKREKRERERVFFFGEKENKERERDVFSLCFSFWVMRQFTFLEREREDRFLCVTKEREKYMGVSIQWRR